MTAPKYIRPVKDPKNWPGKFIKQFPGSQYPWEFRCPAPFCFYVIVAQTESKLDERIEAHKCPWFGGGTTTFSWGLMSDSYIGPIWKMLDDQVDIVKGGGNPDRTDDQIRSDMQQARYTARGLSEALAVLMVPFFTTANEIVKESIVRWEKRQAGEDYETPGLGRLKWKRPNEEFDPSKPSWLTKQHQDAFIKGQAAKEEVEEAPRPVSRHSLPAETVALIKNSKNFPASMLAAAYNITPAAIESIWAE